MHTKDAVAAGETQERLNLVAVQLGGGYQPAQQSASAA
jgi:hypothetical protein